MPLAFGNVGNYPGLGGPIPAYVGGMGVNNPMQMRDNALQKLAFSMEGPYSEQWQQSQINRNADALARSSGQQMEELRADASNRGLAFNDPSVQAEQRRISEGRRTQAIGMAGDVRRGAAGANFAGGMQAANSLLGELSPYGGGGGTSASATYKKPRQGLAFSPNAPYSSYTAPASAKKIPWGASTAQINGLG